MVRVARAEEVGVLIVEDDRKTCQRLCWWLGADGFRVENVSDPRAALARVRQGDFVAVVADLRLAQSPSLDLVREVRALAGFRPWVMYMGVPRRSPTPPYEHGGMFCVLVKGAPLPDLLCSVEQACRSAAREGQASRA